MATAEVMISPASLSRHMPRRGCFKGDGGDLVDALTEACKMPSSSTPLQERTLVPFFSPSQASNTDFTPLQQRAASRAAKSGKKDEAAKAAATSSGGKSGKHRREQSLNKQAGDGVARGSSRSGNRSPPRKRLESTGGKAIDATPGRKDAATPQPVASLTYAGPGFTNSPLPETLPLPTPSLLLMEGLKRQLVL